jgi:hypothetical protein
MGPDSVKNQVAMLAFWRLKSQPVALIPQRSLVV